MSYVNVHMSFVNVNANMSYVNVHMSYVNVNVNMSYVNVNMSYVNVNISSVNVNSRNTKVRDAIREIIQEGFKDLTVPMIVHLLSPHNLTFVVNIVVIFQYVYERQLTL